MATTLTNVRIDTQVKEEASDILSGLGMNISEAVNIFLRQVILRGGLPFQVAYPNYSKELLEAASEAKKIAHDSIVKGYTDLDEAFKELNS